MRTEPFDHRPLGDRSYLIADRANGAAAVIDPQRDVGPYVERARALGCRVVLAMETHLHNDFVSGARRLAQEHGAEVVASRQARLEFPHRAVGAGDVVAMGALRFEVVATPGHTLEHVSYLLRAPEPVLFSGGALSPGGAARIDLFGEETARVLAEHAHGTLRELVALPGATRVLATHVGGSFCTSGGHGGSESTIAAEREGNPLVRASDAASLLVAATRAVPHVPTYYPRVRELNRWGALAPPLTTALPHHTLAALLRRDAVTVVDTRAAADYHISHVRGSLAVGLDGAFGPWVAWLAPTDRPLALVVDRPEAGAMAGLDLGAVGRDDLAGYVVGPRGRGLPLASTERGPAAPLERGLTIVDVRWESEWRDAHIPGALHIPLDELERRAGKLPRERPVAVHCSSGYRSRTAASVLERLGFDDVADLGDGVRIWRESGRAVAR